jgi:hypothetical protein
MVRSTLVIAVCFIVCASGSRMLAAPGGSSPDADRNARAQRLPAPAFEALPAAETGSGERAVAHTFDFWQEAESLTFDSRIADAVCVDLSGDGRPELVRLGIAYGNPYGGMLGITLGGEYGPRGPEVFAHALPSPRSVRAVDLNGDGRLDLIAAHLRPLAGVPNMFVRSALLFVQTGAPGGALEFLDPAPSVDLAPGGELVLLADVDFDQIADLVSVGTAHELYYQKGLGLSQGATPVPLFGAQAVNVSELAAQTAGLPPGSSVTFGFANDLAGGDFDGDGSQDLAVAAGGMAGGGLHVFYHRAAGWVHQGFGTSAPGLPAVTFTSLARGDFDRDGLDDLVATSPSRDLTTLLNSGAAADPVVPAGLSEVTSPGVGLNSVHAVASDFNGDGLTDVACVDALLGKALVAYNPSTNSAPGVFSALPAYFGAFDIRGSGLRALDAVDVDRDGDVDLVGSYLVSQSTSVLNNERLANSRKPSAVLRLRGTPASQQLAHAFVPDGVEYEQGATAELAPGLAVDRFTFQTAAVAGDSLRLRLRLRGLREGIEVRLGLLDAAANHVRWVHAQGIATDLQEIVVLVPDAGRFVPASRTAQVFVMSSASGEPFRLAIDQISAEALP